MSRLGLTDVVAVAANGNTRYALKADGTVWAWGILYDIYRCRNRSSSWDGGDDVMAHLAPGLYLLGTVGVGVIIGVVSGCCLESDVFQAMSHGSMWALGVNALLSPTWLYGMSM